MAPRASAARKRDWALLGRALEEEFGPGALCRDLGGSVAYFVYETAPGLSPYYPTWREWEGVRVRIYALGGSKWRPAHQNGWETLWRSES
ncbi:hypothetical protein MN1_310 [Thermus phage MN1]|nr:hypothetical protein MN1_310 [Thermus phage MN1]